MYNLDPENPNNMKTGDRFWANELIGKIRNEEIIKMLQSLAKKMGYKWDETISDWIK